VSQNIYQLHNFCQICISLLRLGGPIKMAKIQRKKWLKANNKNDNKRKNDKNLKIF